MSLGVGGAGLRGEPVEMFRAVTLRSDEKRRTRWKTLFRWVTNSLEQATEHDVTNLRERGVQPAFS